MPDGLDHVPLGVLPDGGLLFAPLGVLVFVEAGERVICHACGAPVAHVSRAHLSGHGLTLAAYRERFGLNKKQSLLAPALQEQRRAEGRRRLQQVPAVRDGLAAGQAMARAGVLNALGVSAQAPGQSREQGRAGRAARLQVARAGQAERARRQREERAAELGFESLAALLVRRYVEERAPVADIGAELGVGETQVRRLLHAEGMSRRADRAKGGQGRAS